MANLHRPAPPPCPPLIVRCVWPGGGAGRCRQAESTSNMREDVGLWPAGEVEFGTRGQEIETGLGEMLAAFACQPPVEFFAQRVEETDVGGGIVALRLGQQDRKSVVEGRSVSVRVDLGGRRIIKKKIA